jgi:hypothetical protein
MVVGGISDSPPVCIVLSTGRCGSTVLSNIVREHPMVLSVSELFSGLAERDLSERMLSGAAFWDLLSKPVRADTVGLRCRIRLDEMLYPVFEPRAGASRFDVTTGLPPVMQACLPHLTDRPDDLYGELETAAAAQPRRPLSEHLTWLFGMLARDRRPAVVVERSGGSMAYAGQLMRLFPQARVVHLFRDGRECAVSMSRHWRYKIAAIRAAMQARLGYDPYCDAAPEENAVGPHVTAAFNDDPELAGLMPGQITRSRYDQYVVPLSRYGAMWSKMIITGLAELPDPSRVLSLDYRDLVACPERSIERLVTFLGLERDPVFEKEMAAEVGPGRDVQAEAGQRQWEILTRSCRLGMNRLYGRNCWI